MPGLTKLIPAATVTLALGGAAFAISPWWSVAGLGSAATSGDTAMLSEYVDFPALRESVRGQLNAQLVGKMDAELAGNPFAGLGTMLGGVMVDRAVDALITPQMFAQQLAGGDPTYSQIRRAFDLFQVADVEWKSASLVTVRRPYSQAPEMVMTLRRDGLRWRLIDITLPALSY